VLVYGARRDVEPLGRASAIEAFDVPEDVDAGLLLREEAGGGEGRGAVLDVRGAAAVRPLRGVVVVGVVRRGVAGDADALALEAVLRGFLLGAGVVALVGHPLTSPVGSDSMTVQSHSIRCWACTSASPTGVYSISAPHIGQTVPMRWFAHVENSAPRSDRSLMLVRPPG
jgi:hypothetical protein